ncbi:MAG: DUF4363 family protein [Clostridia bacterium]|nr:DUF4363 family protein [Clostridia bacterium]
MRAGKGKLILAWGVLLAIPLVGFAMQWQIDRLCDTVDRGIEASRSMAEATSLEQTADLWQRHQSLLTALVTHEEVDAVTESIRKALAFLYADNPEEFYAALDEAAVDLDVVRKFDKVTFRSIF